VRFTPRSVRWLGPRRSRLGALLLPCALPWACGERAQPAADVPVEVASAERTGCLVPLYAYPTDPSFAQLIAHKARHPELPILAVVNPGTTGAGPRRDAVFAEAIRALSRAGIEVAGYVSLGYGAREAADSEREVDHYRAWYPEVHSIFFDELSTDEAEHDLHVALTEYAHAQGMARTLGNPGTEPSPRSAEVFDVLVVYENAGVPALASLPHIGGSGRAAQGALLAYDVASLDASYVRDAARQVAYLYVTDDQLDNPYDRLPAYFEALLDALEGPSAP